VTPLATDRVKDGVAARCFEHEVLRAVVDDDVRAERAHVTWLAAPAVVITFAPMCWRAGWQCSPHARATWIRMVSPDFSSSVSSIETKRGEACEGERRRDSDA